MLSTQNRSNLLPSSVSWHISDKLFNPCLYAIALFFLASYSAFNASCMTFYSAAFFSSAALITSSFACFCFCFLSYASCFFFSFSASISANSFLILGSLSWAVSKSLNNLYRSSFSCSALALLFSLSIYLRSYLSYASDVSYSSYWENSLQLLKFYQNL